MSGHLSYVIAAPPQQDATAAGDVVLVVGWWCIDGQPRFADTFSRFGVLTPAAFGRAEFTLPEPEPVP